MRRSQPDGEGISRQRNSQCQGLAVNKGLVYLRKTDSQPGWGGESWGRSQKGEGRVMEGGLGI